MEEKNAIMGILLVSALAVTGYFVLDSGAQGAVPSQSYVGCCCNILVADGNQILVRSQIQTFAANCQIACERYTDEGYVFPQAGFCGVNP